jgi:ceramide glucosyltransferase
VHGYGWGAMISFGLATVLILVGAYAIGATAAAVHFSRRPPGAAPECVPSVTVLKPLHGSEPELRDNLRSFAAQDYPLFQLVLGVRDRTDSALPVADALIRDRPGHDIELVVDPRAAGSNLKVANLENMLPVARHDVIVLADSDMRVGRDYLRVVTAPLADPRTGVVTCLYKGVPDSGLWSRLAALHINFGFLPSALVGDRLGIGGGCFGATIAVRRAVLDRIGGFGRLRNELADDHRLGSAVRELGLNTVLSPYIVENIVSEPSLASLWRHELRWARTSRAMAPTGYAGSVTTHTVALTALAATASGSDAAWGIILLSLAARWLSAAIIARALDLPRNGLWLLPLRDALSFAVFLGSFCGRSVSWRNQLFRVAPSGRMSVEGD